VPSSVLLLVCSCLDVYLNNPNDPYNFLDTTKA
jgi:hypothetical protein